MSLPENSPKPSSISASFILSARYVERSQSAPRLMIWAASNCGLIHDIRTYFNTETKKKFRAVTGRLTTKSNLYPGI